MYVCFFNFDRDRFDHVVFDAVGDGCKFREGFATPKRRIYVIEFSDIAGFEGLIVIAIVNVLLRNRPLTRGAEGRKFLLIGNYRKYLANT